MYTDKKRQMLSYKIYLETTTIKLQAYGQTNENKEAVKHSKREDGPYCTISGNEIVLLLQVKQKR